MKIYSLLCCFSFSLVAMDNNNFKTSYLTYEDNEDKGDACILHVPTSKFEVKENMTFVHKKGIPITENNAISSCFLDINKPALIKNMEIATSYFLREIVQLDTINKSSTVCTKFNGMSLSFKKPQVRIVEKSKINCEEFGIFGHCVDTDFLQMKVTTQCSISNEYHRIFIWCYVSGKKDSSTIIPYKVYFPDYNNMYVRSDKEVRYF